MSDIIGHLDLGSRLVIFVTFVLFSTALVVKGVGHDILLEAGVFLVSLKLILTSYRNGVTANDLTERLARLERTLARVDERLQALATSPRS